MKKSLIALLSVLVVLVFTASAFALHEVKSAEYTPSLVKASKAQIELNGEIRIRGNLQKNFDLNDKTEDTAQKYDQRVRLGVKATLSPNTFGAVELETNNAAHTSGSYDWGTGTESKRSALYIRQAYIAHQTDALGTMTGFKAGHMLLGLGNRLFFDHTNYGDDAIVLWANAGPAEISLIDIKVSEGNQDNTTAGSRSHDHHGTRPKSFNMDDYDAYVLAAVMPVNSINVSGDVTYLRQRATDAETGLGAATDGSATVMYTDGTKFFNYGLRGDAALGGVKIKADAEYQHGSSYRNRDRGVGTAGKVKYEGYAWLLGAEANAGPMATVRVNGAYGSGNKVAKRGHEDKREEGFQTLLTDNQYSTFIYDYSLMGASNYTRNPNGTINVTNSSNRGLTNTMYANVGATVKPMADLKVSADYYYLRAPRAVALNGAKKSEPNGVNNLTSRDLGHEVDAKIEYQIDTNLAYYIEAGYLFAGDAYDRNIDYRSTRDNQKNVDIDNPYRIRHGIILQF